MDFPIIIIEYVMDKFVCELIMFYEFLQCFWFNYTVHDYFPVVGLVLTLCKMWMFLRAYPRKKKNLKSPNKPFKKKNIQNRVK